MEVPRALAPLFTHYARSLQLFMQCQTAKVFMYDKQPVSVLIELSGESKLKINTSLGIAHKV